MAGVYSDNSWSTSVAASPLLSCSGFTEREGCMYLFCKEENCNDGTGNGPSFSFTHMPVPVVHISSFALLIV